MGSEIEKSLRTKHSIYFRTILYLSFFQNNVEAGVLLEILLNA